MKTFSLYFLICFGGMLSCLGQTACLSGKLDSNAKKVLPFMPNLTLEEERNIPVAVRRSQSPPDINPVPESKLHRMKITTDSIPVIVFRPDNMKGRKKLPLIIDYHGGAFVYPLQPWMYHWSYELANMYDALVMAVDYRVAPEHRFPAAVTDSYNAYKWALDHAESLGGDTSKIMITGASSGGNLAIVVSQLAKKDGSIKKIKMISLLCPSVANPVNSTYPSMVNNATGYGLTRNSVLWAIENYSTDFSRDSSDARMFPILSNDLTGLPPTLMYTAEFDVLRDEGLAYAAKLKEAGVPVVAKCFQGHLHTLMGIAANAPELAQINADVHYFIRKYWK